MTKQKPAKFGTVFTAIAKIRYIDEVAQRWVTVATCIDTPVAIRKALQKARGDHSGKTLWTFSDLNGSKIPGLHE